MDGGLGSYSKVFLVTGSGRSGTNISKEILGRHSSIATLPFEHRFTIDPRGVVDFYTNFPSMWSPFWADKKIKDFIGFLRSLGKESDEKRARVETAQARGNDGLKETPPCYAGWNLEEFIPGYQLLIDNLENELVAFRYSAVWPGADEGIKNHEMLFSPRLYREDLRWPLTNFLEKIYRAILNLQGKNIFLEDNTHSLLFADELLDLHPNGHLLHVIRDPRDVLASLMTQRWAPSHLPNAIVWYKSVMESWFLAREALPRERYHEARLEDVLCKDHNALQNIAYFLGVELEPSMLSVDLSKGNIGRYKNDLSRSDILLIEQELGKIIEEYGYR